MPWWCGVGLGGGASAAATKRWVVVAMVLLVCSRCCQAQVAITSGGVVLKHDLSAGKTILPVVRDRRLWEQTAEVLLNDRPAKILQERAACSEAEQLPDSTKVVVSVDRHVWDLFLNWLAFYVSKGCGDPSNLHLVCMDQYSRQEVRSMGLICSTFVTFPAKFNERMIWHTRFGVVGNLLMRGFDVVVSDADAVWLNPVAPHIQSLQNNTVLAAMRCSNPRNLAWEWGAALNFGFLYLRSVEMATLIQEEVRRAVKHDRLLNDQTVLNGILSNQKLHVETKVSGVHKGTQTEYGGFPPKSRLHGKSVAFLPPELFPRHNCRELKDVNDVAVLHCAHLFATVKRRVGYDGTIRSLKQLGAWYKQNRLSP